MFFIGVISEKNEFEKIKKSVSGISKIELVYINKNSIENLKNIKFDSIVIINAIEKIYTKNENLRELTRNLKYLIINSDIEIRNNIFDELKANIITFGSNHKSTITFSSITDGKVLISVQRNFRSISGGIVEVGEYNIDFDDKSKINIEELMVEFVIKNLYFDKKTHK